MRSRQPGDAVLERTLISPQAAPALTFDTLEAPQTRVDPMFWRRFSPVLDAVSLLLAVVLALATAGSRNGRYEYAAAVLFPLLVLGFLHLRQDRNPRLSVSLLDVSARVIAAVSIAAMAETAALTILGDHRPGRLVLLLWIFSAGDVALARLAVLMIQRRATLNGQWHVPTLIVGAGVVADRLARRLQSDPRYGLRPVGFLDADPLPQDVLSDGPSLPVMGTAYDLDLAIERTGARHVILSFSSEPDHVLAQRVKRCRELGVEVSLVPRLYELINDRSTLDHIGGMPIVSLRPTDPRGWQFAVKHAMDKSLTVLALILLAPLLIVVAAAVKLTSRGPVFFRQRRVGRDGKVFDLLKFRTMHVTDSREVFRPPAGMAPGGVEGRDNRTLVGKVLRRSSIDELPQLFNVLRGDMSLVGPRPERPEYVAEFLKTVTGYEDRHRVKSGITGWAQVSGLRGQTSIADRIEWDNYYIQSWSLRLDLRIVVLTIAEILRFRG